MDKVTMWTIALIAMGIGLWSLDLKIVVVSPTAAMPSGATMVVYEGREFGLIDSVEALCERCLSPTNWCRNAEVDALNKGSRVQLTLPYSEILFGLSGASRKKWEQRSDAGEGNWI